MRDKRDFLEYAEVFGNHYGTSKQWLSDQLDAGNDVILEIDWQGAQQVRQVFPENTSIFILPPSKEILLERLRSRGQDSEEVISRRTLEAVTEMSHYHEFDFTIINDDFDTAVEEVKSVMISRHVRTAIQQQNQKSLIQELLE
jgi:guanylate kinase